MEHVLKVEKRSATGKATASRLRRQGRMPGVLYGDNKDPVALTVDPAAVDRILELKTGVNTIFDLELEGSGQRRPAMIHDVQRHPIGHGLIHADFIRVNPDRKVHVRVPVVLHGTPEGVKNQGGIIEFLARDVGLECLPADIPEEIDVDVSSLEVGNSVRVRELPIDADKLRVMDDAETVIVLVAVPAAAKEAAAEEAAAEAEAAEAETPAAEAPAAEAAKPAEGAS